MKNHKIFLKSLLMFICIASTTMAQIKTDALMYGVYINKEVNTDAWKAAVLELTSALSKTPNDHQARVKLAIAQFGLLNASMRNHNEDLFDEYYDEHIRLVKSLIDSDKKWAEPPALLSSAYGLKIGFSPMQGMFLGQKCGNLIEKAKILNPNYALVWKVYGNSKFFTPEMWGGDLDEAIISYEKCIQLYELKPDELKHNWMYLDALVYPGRAYAKSGDTSRALVTYEKALKAEPDFAWVKYSLLPKAKVKAQGK